MNSPINHNHRAVSVEVRGLRKSFRDHPVLQGLDFTVKPGEIFVIMGPSGSGKSVLLRHIIGLEIRGELWASPVPEHLFIKTKIDLETGQVMLGDATNG